MILEINLFLINIEKGVVFAIDSIGFLLFEKFIGKLLLAVNLSVN